MRAAPRRGRAALGTKIVATTQLLEEVAVSQYALHAGIHLQHIKSVWRDLWGHVATQLRTGKGVVVPEVGCIVLQSGGVCAQQQFLPVLHLSNSLHGRFESPDLSSIAYEQVAHRSRIHPSICRRIVQEALMQLNQHIASSSYLQVELPGIGWLHSEGRDVVRLELDEQLLQRFPLKSPLTWPPSAQVLTVHNSPRQLSRPYTPQQTQATCVQPVVQSEPLGALSVHAGLDSLAHVCFAADTLRTGYVTRLVLEDGLRQHCRLALHSFSAPALLDLMDAHAAGHSDKFVRYKTFLHAMDLLLSDQGGPGNTAATGAAGNLVELRQSPEDFNQANKVHVMTESPAVPAAVEVAPWKLASPAVQSVVPASAQPAPRPCDVSRPATAHDHASYYLQGRQKYMTRAECDAFNHMHFTRLRSAHGKRGVTPKVQQEALTQEEVALLQPIAPVQILLQSPQGTAQVVTGLRPDSSTRRPSSPASIWQCNSARLEPELQIEKQARAHDLQQGWQQQMQEKDKILHDHEQAEKQWPHSPPRQSHMRVANTPPKHAGHASAAAWDIPAVHQRTHSIV
ncbi:hypothetical protein WJX79_009404 [Trebouxia sp. C0005]